MSVAVTWGSTAAERSLSFGCDGALAGINGSYWRAISIGADPDLIFRWLCQMRLAPYSYDWIDNLGRTSPTELQPGLAEKLSVGQTMMFIFKVVSFERDKEITLLVPTKGLFRYITGSAAISYRINGTPNGDGQSSRLVAKLVMAYPAGPLGWLSRLVLPWGDLVMMRQQFRNFKRLAERDATTVGPSSVSQK